MNKREYLGVTTRWIIPLLLCAQVVCAQTARIKLQSSSDLTKSWNDVPLAAASIRSDGTIAALIQTNTNATFYRLIIGQEPTTPPSEPMVAVAGGTMADGYQIGPISVGPFAISRFETTWEQWQLVRNWASGRGYDLQNRGNAFASNHPVHSVDWYDVVKWCNAKSEMEGLSPVYKIGEAVYRSGQNDSPIQDPAANGYRLPSQAEWEFAFRGGNLSKGYLYSGSTNVLEVSWYSGNAGFSTAVVGTKLPNELGLYDMGGNVSEWTGSISGFSRVKRGGSWRSSAGSCARNSTGSASLNFTSDDSGFRYVRTLVP